MRIEISRWTGNVLVALGAVMLLAVTVVAAALIPYLPRLVRAAQALPTAVDVVTSAPLTQQQVARIDGNVQTLTPPVRRATRDLADLSPQLRTLSAQLAAAETTISQLRSAIGTTPGGGADAGLAAQLGALQTSVGQVAAALEPLAEPLTPVAADLHRLAGDARPLPTALDRLNASTAVLQQLPGYFQQLNRTLDDVAVHVRDLDRKTGPTPP